VTLDYRNPTNVVRLSASCSTPTVQRDCQDEALFYSGVAYNTLQAKSDRATLRSYVDYKITENCTPSSKAATSRPTATASSSRRSRAPRAAAPCRSSCAATTPT
jgi:hypothetical protein